MTGTLNFDAIIIGGSYSGLSAAMGLGRALRKVLVIDNGKPCNIQTPYSHNFLTQDGKTPKEILAAAKKQVEKYDTVNFYNGFAHSGIKSEEGFEITTDSGKHFTAKKLLFATGIKDTIPNIKGFAECWGISILHCPYCHGYEVKNEKTGIFGNGDYGFEFSKLILNWTKDLTLFTNGPATLTVDQAEKLKTHNINIIEKEIDSFEHNNGHLQNIVFKDSSTSKLKAVYSRIPFEQHSDIPVNLGCELTDQGHIKVDLYQKTSVDGIYACGDNTMPMRSVSSAVAGGTLSGAMINMELVNEMFS